MTPKHSPGPWTVANLPDGQHHILGAFDDSVAATCYPFHGAEARAANARLLGAAPDLLQALDAIVQLVDEGKTITPYSHEYRAALNAIAKATK